jgi:hypothetical protein
MLYRMEGKSTRRPVDSFEEDHDIVVDFVEVVVVLSTEKKVEEAIYPLNSNLFTQLKKFLGPFSNFI